MGEGEEQVYDQIAREAIEHALGRTFENPEAIPRRDAFIRDATDLLARFVAARCGNPGFHSARFFDAVIALSNARTRIRDAARRSRVVERLVEAERRVRSLETALQDRNEQLVAAAGNAQGGGDDAAQVATLARALADADARIRTLERELGDERNKAASGPGEGGSRANTALLDRLDAEEFLDETGKAVTEGARPAKAFDPEQTDSLKLEMPSPPPAPRTQTARVALAAASRELVHEPERRFAALRGEMQALEEALGKAKAEREQLELERDALQAQLDQVVQREAPLREAKAAIGRDRDALAARVPELERERDALAAKLADREKVLSAKLAELEGDLTAKLAELARERDVLLARVAELEREREVVRGEKVALERDRDDIVRSRSALSELKKAVEQELALAQQEREELRRLNAEKEAARARANADSERAHESLRAAEVRIDRESTAAARARRERDERSAERDRLKSANAELRAFKERFEQLALALGADPAAPLPEVLREIGRRHEVVLAHERPEWEPLRARVEGLKAKDALATEAEAWIARLDAARARYDTLMAAAESGAESASSLLELARIVTTHEDDLRALDLLDVALGA